MNKMLQYQSILQNTPSIIIFVQPVELFSAWNYFQRGCIDRQSGQVIFQYKPGCIPSEVFASKNKISQEMSTSGGSTRQGSLITDVPSPRTENIGYMDAFGVSFGSGFLLSV